MCRPADGDGFNFRPDVPTISERVRVRKRAPESVKFTSATRPGLTVRANDRRRRRRHAVTSTVGYKRADNDTNDDILMGRVRYTRKNTRSHAITDITP